MKAKQISIVGGCGHVGLPLGIVLADAGYQVALIDIDQTACEVVNSGKLPFLELPAATTMLNVAIKSGKIIATTDPAIVARSQVVFFVTGTPVDRHLNPQVSEVTEVIKNYLPYLHSEQLIILRSTVYPGVVELIGNLLTEKLGQHKLAFCPERIAQGHGIAEIRQLPQIVAGTTEIAEQEAAALFVAIAPKVVILTPAEAELAKLITNSWRYLEFAIANQFYMMTEARGLDFYKIYDAVCDDYPRAKYFATPGFAAGPCLFKDTMQLAAFHENHFFLGHAAMLVNEGLPVFIAKQMAEQLGTLQNKKIAILGMAFKANNDDKRESLSFKLKKVLEIQMAVVLTTDIYDSNMQNYEDVIQQADGVILGVPHREYVDLTIDKPFIDCWGVWRKRK